MRKTIPDIQDGFREAILCVNMAEVDVIIRRNFLIITTMIFGMCGLASFVSAQDYPVKPIRMVLPSPPGGGTDLLGRIVQEGLRKSWGQPVVADNRSGASGMRAAEMVAKSAPDGYTLFTVATGVLTINQPLYRKIRYDPVNDFEPVAMIVTVPSILIAHPSLPVNSVSELIKLAKSKPGELVHAATNNGTISHMSMELFKQMAGINMVKVPFGGDAPALASLLGGHVQMMFQNVVIALPHVQSGKLRALAVATPVRTASLPNLPTVAESGLPGYETNLFYATVAPAKTPSAIIRKLNAEITKIKQSPEVSDRLSKMGAVSIDLTPAELGALIKRDLAKWGKVIRDGNILPN